MKFMDRKPVTGLQKEVFAMVITVNFTVISSEKILYDIACWSICGFAECVIEGQAFVYSHEQ